MVKSFPFYLSVVSCQISLAFLSSLFLVHLILSLSFDRFSLFHSLSLSEKLNARSNVTISLPFPVISYFRQRDKCCYFLPCCSACVALRRLSSTLLECLFAHTLALKKLGSVRCFFNFK